MHDIVAIGGSTLPKAELMPIHRYALELTGKAKPRVCFIPTASGDGQDRIDAFYAAFSPDVCEPSHLPLFHQTVCDVGAFLARQDLIYVGGGNTRNMLVLWKLWGVDAAIRAAWDRGAVLAGVSAGALCWFESGITDSYAGEFRDLPCLGWTPGSFCPHYDSEARRQPVVQRLVGDGKLPPGYAVEDDAAIHVRDGEPVRAIAQRPGKNAFSVRAVNGAAVLEPIASTAL